MVAELAETFAAKLGQDGSGNCGSVVVCEVRVRGGGRRDGQNRGCPWRCRTDPACPRRFARSPKGSDPSAEARGLRSLSPEADDHRFLDRSHPHCFQHHPSVGHHAIRHAFAAVDFQCSNSSDWLTDGVPLDGFVEEFRIDRRAAEMVLQGASARFSNRCLPLFPRTTPRTPTSAPAGPRCERWRETTPARSPRRRGNAPSGRGRRANPCPWPWCRRVGSRYEGLARRRGPADWCWAVPQNEGWRENARRKPLGDEAGGAPPRLGSDPTPPSCAQRTGSRVGALGRYPGRLNPPARRKARSKVYVVAAPALAADAPIR